MKKVSQIVEEIYIAFDHISEHKKRLDETWKTLDALRKELDDYINLNFSVNQNKYDK